MNIKPLGNRVLIEKLEREEKSAGGLILSSSPIANLGYGKIVAIGPGFYTNSGSLIPCSVKEGDCVFYNTLASKEMSSDMVMISEPDIYGIES